MGSAYKETMDKIENLTQENEKLRKYNKALKECNESLERELKVRNEVFDLLHNIDTCIRFIDKEKAFDTIMEMYRESVEVYGE